MYRDPPFELNVGDRYKAIGRKLYNGVDPADLTGLTVQFYMIGKNAVSPTVNWGTATIVSATAGTVKYTFGASETTTAGQYRGWFRAGSGGLWTTYPASHLGIPIIIHDLHATEDDEDY